MKRTRWQRLEQLFLAAVERPPGEREAYVRSACPDESLRREVLELLEHDVAPERETVVRLALARSARKAAGSSPEDAWSGRALGPYRIEREIGRGGMGIVLLAHRSDGAFERKVAIKLSLANVVSGPLAEQLATERRILAGLDHPAIARLLDGGATPEGAPYVVMEYVAGRPIDAYCRERSLGLRERIGLFLTICDAVEHAHRTLVVHRDLKPSNILVTAEGRPKLLDFGIAKLLEPDPSGAGEPATRTLMRAMTPEYASPEQLRGERTTTASDVYALGVVLFELLAGRRPRRLETDSPTDAGRAQLTRDPPRPSTVSTFAFSRSLRGDLDNIVLVALRQEPERRYAGVHELADDLRRYLEGRPVTARPNTLGYRLRRFVGRHRVGVAAATLAAVALAAGVGFHTQRLARERDRAVQAAEKSEQIAGYLEQLFMASNPDEAQGREITALELLDRGASTIAESLASDPEVGADLLMVMAGAYRSLAAYDRTEDLLDQAHQIVAAHEGERSPRYAEVLSSRAALRAAQGREDEAMELSERAAGILDTAPPDDPRAATALHNLALLRLRAARYEEAARLAGRAHERRTALLGPSHPRSIASLAVLAKARRALGETERARVLLEQVLDERLATLGEHHSAVAETLVDLAAIDELEGDLLRAVERMERALAIRKLIFPPAHPTVGAAMINLSGILQETEDFERAENLAREALGIFRKSLVPTHPYVALARERLAQSLTLQGRTGEALALQRENVEALREHYGTSHPRFVTALHNLATVLHDAGEFRSAREVFDELVPLWEQLVGPDHENVAFARAARGKLLIDLADPSAARNELLRAREIAAARLGEDSRVVAAHVHHLGRAALLAGRFDEARRLLEESLTMRRRLFEEPANLSFADSHHARGELELATGRWESARAAFDGALAMRREVHGRPHMEIVLSLAGRARALAGLGDAAGAASTADEAVAMAREIDAPPHALGAALVAQAAARQATGDADGARRAREAGIAALARAYPEHHPLLAAARDSAS
jgi:serine/threonine-protein kinase